MAGFSKRIPSDSLRYLLVCVIGIIAFAAIAIYPSQKSIEQLDEKINNLRYQVERQKSLYPLYLELKKRIDATPVPDLPLPAPAAYPRDRIDAIASAFEPAVEGSGVFLAAVTPDVRALGGDASILPVQIVLTGDFLEFQNVLTRLGSIPFMTRIEGVRVKQVPGTREMEVKTYIALEK